MFGFDSLNPSKQLNKKEEQALEKIKNFFNTTLEEKRNLLDQFNQMELNAMMIRFNLLSKPKP